jgi:hypothetical protein
VLAVLLRLGDREDGAELPITHVIDRVRQRMVTHVDGIVTFHDITCHLEQEQRDHGLDLPELFDARYARIDLTARQVRQLVYRVAQMARTTPFGQTAIVTTDNTTYGLARMFSMLADSIGISVEVFRDVDAAERWLAESRSSR